MLEADLSSYRARRASVLQRPARGGDGRWSGRPLEAACARKRASLFGEATYPTLRLKAAALLDSLIHHQALVDGNTRLVRLAAVVHLAAVERGQAIPAVLSFSIALEVRSGSGARA